MVKTMYPLAMAALVAPPPARMSPKGSKGPGYKPVFKTADAIRLGRECMAQRTLADAGLVLRRWARKLAARKPDTRWAPELRKLARWCRAPLGPTPWPVFMVDGNDKVPFVVYSSLSIVMCPDRGECERWCYSRATWRHTGPYTRQLMNSLILAHRPDVIRDAFGELPDGITLRLYVDGDFDSPRTMALWFSLLAGRPDVKAYGYSKAWDMLYRAHLRGEWPPNYVVNLSDGGRTQLVERSTMEALPMVRGEFLAVDWGWRPEGQRGNWGTARYDSPEHRREVLANTRAMRPGSKAMPCPGTCGDCTPLGHACGLLHFKGVVIGNGKH